MEEYYKWNQGGGFIIRFCEKTEFFKLYEVPIHGGAEQHLGNFESISEAKKYADECN